MKFRRTIADDLSFKGQKLIRGRHKIHPYPAMMHPLVVDELLSRYAESDDVVFDPFCGSGSVLLGAAERQHLCMGFDINPLALLIAKAKTTNYNASKLQSELKEIRERIQCIDRSEIPPLTNPSFWYSQSVLDELSRIRAALISSELDFLPFFTVCFAYVCRRCSYTRKQEFKRHREPKEKRNLQRKNPVEAFFQHVDSIMPAFVNARTELAACSLQLANSESKFDHDFKYDLVLTSPPYGDHSTTVAYGQFSSFGNEWTRGVNPFHNITYTVDREGLGKRQAIAIEISNFPILADTIDRICTVNQSRSEDVTLYFDGYHSALTNIITHLSDGGFACFVVGNRTVAGIEVPLDQITAEFMSSLGMELIEIRSRDITNKVLPLENSPSNIAGRRSKTMTREYVVVCKKSS